VTHIVITGPMGAGKTTAGRLVAQRLDRKFLDSDLHIEAQLDTTARRIAAEDGVYALHRVEADSLRAALGFPEPAVIAAAASIGDLEGVDGLLDGQFIVLVDGDTQVLTARATAGEHRRPLSVEEYSRLADRRRDRLGPLVDLVVDVTRASPDETAHEIFAAFQTREEAGT
jgi:shikimate kinase